MTVKEIIESGRMKLIESPPFCEKRFAIVGKQSLEPIGYIKKGEAIPEEFADRKVWLAFHWDGINPDVDEHVCQLCVE